MLTSQDEKIKHSKVGSYSTRWAETALPKYMLCYEFMLRMPQNLGLNTLLMCIDGYNTSLLDEMLNKTIFRILIHKFNQNDTSIFWHWFIVSYADWIKSLCLLVKLY